MTVYEAILVPAKMRSLPPEDQDDLVRHPDFDDGELNDWCPMWIEIADLNELTKFNGGKDLAASTLEKIDRCIRRDGFYRNRIFAVRERKRL